MLFCSQQFVIFFLVVFTAYWACPWREARVWLLLVASYWFYMSWNASLALVIAVSSTIDYVLGRLIDGTPSEPRRKGLVLFSILMNLGILCYFKYANFFLRNLEELLARAGMPTALPVLSVVLPIGISFYTFEAINYTIDVYRRKTAAERNLGHFMLFILFFPHLVAGPIVRARGFLPQIRRVKRWDWLRAHLGVQYVVMGLFKKLAIADRMAMFVDPVFAHPDQYESHAVIIAVIAYALQIYCDFSGYTDMAIGFAHLFGYKLARNFNMPYVAASIAEFWHRWHISLSTWLRDYLYIPMGGSRGTEWQTQRNLFLTMVIGGFWHGASWTFVAWGVWHGLLLCVHRAMSRFVERSPGLSAVAARPWMRAVGGAATFMCVCFGWVLFRATTFEQAWQVLERTVVVSMGKPAPMYENTFWWTVGLVIACHWMGSRCRWQRLSLRLPAPLLGAAYALVATAALLFAPAVGKAFIYFQF